jgi:hypothetical protein
LRQQNQSESAVINPRDQEEEMSVYQRAFMVNYIKELVLDTFDGEFNADDVYSLDGGKIPDIPMYKALDSLVEEGKIERLFDPNHSGMTHKSMRYKIIS